MDAMAGALSALRWWQEAGVDTLVDDAPRDWLRPLPAAPAPSVRSASGATPAPALPDTLEGLRRWLLDPANLADLGATRIDAAGDPAAGPMLLVDLPEPEDAAAGHLIAGEAGRLLDRMLVAIGRDRGSVYLAAIAPARPSGGRLAPAAAELLAQVARRHVALARPKALLLLGQGAARAFGQAWPGEPGRLRDVNHDGGTILAIATCHPCFLLRQPARKADAWKDLQAFMKELAR